jgi:hypothetical protein
MKKYLVGLFAIAIAICSVAFTNVSTKATQMYWFEYTISGQVIPLDDDAPLVESDPYGCPSEGNDVCTRAYFANDVVDSGPDHIVPNPMASSQVEVKREN